jgi:transcriptional regulator with XRE-family HTH domain
MSLRRSPTVEQVVGQRLRQIRVTRRLSAEDLVVWLAERGEKVSTDTVYRVELGRVVPRLNLVYQLAAALGVSPIALMLPAGEDEPVALTPAQDAPAQAVYEWMTGGRLDPFDRGEQLPHTRADALAHLHDLVPYAKGSAERMENVSAALRAAAKVLHDELSEREESDDVS